MESEATEDFVVIRLSALRLNLAAAYEAERDTPTPVYVVLKDLQGEKA